MSKDKKDKKDKNGVVEPTVSVVAPVGVEIETETPVVVAPLSWNTKELETVQQIAALFNQLEFAGYTIGWFDFEYKSGKGVWEVIYRIEKKAG